MNIMDRLSFIHNIHLKNYYATNQKGIIKIMF